jgi:hypothetical protein
MGKSKTKGGMGYRDLERFNMALLIKQGWRLIQQPHTLHARIYKEKYFSNDTFLNSELGRRPSYAWRSIWNARKLPQDGLVWRVGDGKTIKIWGDRWLETPTTFLVQSSVKFLNREATVSELIDDATKLWKSNVLSEVFKEEEAQIISSMVISPSSQRDRLVWGGGEGELNMGNIFSGVAIILLRRWQTEAWVVHLIRPTCPIMAVYMEF